MLMRGWIRGRGWQARPLEIWGWAGWRLGLRGPVTARSAGLAAGAGMATGVGELSPAIWLCPWLTAWLGLGCG